MGMANRARLRGKRRESASAARGLVADGPFLYLTAYLTAAASFVSFEAASRNSRFMSISVDIPFAID